MPTYEYECRSCSHVFEKFQSITARPLRKCEQCGGSVRRLIGAGAGVIFRGSGFYETDYKRKRSGPSGEKKEKPEGGDKPGDGAKKDGSAKKKGDE